MDAGLPRQARGRMRGGWMLLVLVRYQDAAALRDVTVGHIRDTRKNRATR